MASVEALIATVGQKDFKLIKKMNIQSDVLFANQDDGYRYEEMPFQGHLNRMLTTPDRGVGRNRNKALLYAKGDILLFGDDDTVYEEGYEEEILKAYKELPGADVIIFGLHSTKEGQIYATRKNKTKKISIFQAMRYGAGALSIKKESWLRSNIYFSNLFGGGCPFGSGEDSLFIRECFRKRLNVYTHGYILGRNARDSSSWFIGYTKKYYYDKGVLHAALFPNLSWLMCVQFLVRHRDLREKNLTWNQAAVAMLAGRRDWKRKKGTLTLGRRE